jgi:nitrous oxidase accessory protein NosD
MRQASAPAGVRLGVTLVALAVVMGFQPRAFGAPQQAVSCGSVIAADTTLTADVLGCRGDGLVIGADGIVLDLGGHVVGGDAIEDPADVGIRVNGHHHVTITDGTVKGFYRGIVFEGAAHGTVTSMTVRDSTRRGIVLLDGSDDGLVRGNVEAGNGASGVAIVTSDGASVTRNRSLGNIGGAGVRLEGATHAFVAHNSSDGDTFGAQITDGADHNVLVQNHWSNEVEAAVEESFSNDNLLSSNYVTHTSGITLESSDDNTITGNRVVHLTGPDGIGIQIYGNRNVVTTNTVVDTVRYGIEVDDFQDENHSPATDNVIRDNTVVGGDLGIAIGPEAGGVVLNTVVDANRVTGASDDGIQLVGPSTGLETSVVSRNVAVHNGDFGIEAVPGTRDGGGNRAAGNGNPLQCLNVACSP